MSSYSNTYGCGGDEAKHVCHDCPGGRKREFARVRQGGYIYDDYLPTILANPLNLASWTAGITAGKIIVMPRISGTYDPGDPKELKGFGDVKTEYGQRTMKIAMIDPDFEDNYHFYNEIKDRKNLVPFFCTSSLLRICDKPAAIKAKDPVSEELDDQVLWNVDHEVISDNLPIMVKKATLMSIFSCSSF